MKLIKYVIPIFLIIIISAIIVYFLVKEDGKFYKQWVCDKVEINRTLILKPNERIDLRDFCNVEIDEEVLYGLTEMDYCERAGGFYLPIYYADSLHTESNPGWCIGTLEGVVFKNSCAQDAALYVTGYFEENCRWE